MDQATTGSVLGDQIGMSLVVVWILEKLKKASWMPWLTQHTDVWNRVLSVFLGSIAAAGIVWSYDPTGGVLTVKGLTLINGLTFLWIVAKQSIFQEAIYKGLVKPNETATIAKVVAIRGKAEVIEAVQDSKEEVIEAVQDDKGNR
jgi:hypothetical protein